MSEKVIVNELLCFIANKFDSVDSDSLVLLCTKAFTDEDITAAKAILKDACDTLDFLGSLRITGRTGNDKGKRSMEDIIAMMHKLGGAGPIFAATNLKKLPPVGFDSIDVTHLLFRLEKFETEARFTREAESKTVDTIERLETEIRALKSLNAKTCELLNTTLESSLPTPNLGSLASSNSQLGKFSTGKTAPAPKNSGEVPLPAPMARKSRVKPPQMTGNRVLTPIWCRSRCSRKFKKCESNQLESLEAIR